MALITCPECGKEVSDKADKCPNCGAPVEKPAEKKKEEVVQEKKKGSLSNLIALIVLIVIIIFAVSKCGGSKSELQKVTETTTEQSENIENILEKCGIKHVDSIKADELLNDTNEKGEKGYRISADGIDNIILYLKKDNKVNIVRYADNNLYAKGKVVSKLSDYALTSDEEAEIRTKCQQMVEEVLKSPSTAKFPWAEWGIVKNKEKVAVRSHVDSENSFGAMVRSEFSFIFAKDGTVESFVIDGEEMIRE